MIHKDHQQENKQTLSQKGYIALSMILVIAAVMIGVVTTTTLLSIGEGESGLTLATGENTLAFVEGCTEDALLKARASNTYTGGNITRPEGTCTVTVTKSGNTWTLTVSTTATTYVRTIQAIITNTGYGDSIVSWKEI